MKKCLAVTVLLGFMAACSGTALLYAGEVDILLQKLVEKGVLTGAEAQQVKIETQEQVKKEVATGKSASLPAWVQNIKLKGDLRLRYQYQHENASNDYAKDTQVGRVRARLGLESKINEKLLAGIGIATSSNGDPRSTNVTFGKEDSGMSSKMGIRLDYAYAKYTPLPSLEFVGGKMLLNDALWEPTDLIWDTDITPEGGVVKINKAIGPDTQFFMNTGALIEEDDDNVSNNPIMGYMAQPGVTYKINDDLGVKGAFTFYSFNTKNNAYPNAAWYKSNTNSKSGANWTYNFQMISPALEFSIKEPFKAAGLNVEKLKFFGEYVNNLAAENDNTGFSLGFQFGHDKVEKWGDWQFRYIYAMLEKDSVPDVLPDSDRYGGKTGMRSHEGALTFGLAKNTSFGVDVYRSWNILGTSAKAPETLVQVDWNMKF
ncbi:MAG: putative porin [Candidatus Omnitrophota bacterium]